MMKSYTQKRKRRVMKMKNKNLKEYNVKKVLSKKAIKLIMTSAILFSGGYTLVNAGNGDIKSILQIAEASVSHRDTERISIGNNHTLAIRDDGYVYAWGEYLWAIR